MTSWGAQCVSACDSWSWALKAQLLDPPDVLRSQWNVDDGQFRENQIFKKRDRETPSLLWSSHTWVPGPSRSLSRADFSKWFLNERVHLLDTQGKSHEVRWSTEIMRCGLCPRGARRGLSLGCVTNPRKSQGAKRRRGLILAMVWCRKVPHAARCSQKNKKCLIKKKKIKCKELKHSSRQITGDDHCQYLKRNWLNVLYN